MLDPTRVQSFVCCLFSTNRNSMAVTSIFLSHYTIRNMNPSIGAICKWKYLLLLKLWCILKDIGGPIENHQRKKNLMQTKRCKEPLLTHLRQIINCAKEFSRFTLFHKKSFFLDLFPPPLPFIFLIVFHN